VLAHDYCSRAVFILVLEPFSSSELDDSTAITFNVRAMNALIRHKVLPLDHLVAFLSRTVQLRLWALLGDVLFNDSSSDDIFAVLVGTSHFQVMAHVGDEPGSLVRAGEEICSARGTLRSLAVTCTGAVFLEAGSAECMVAVEDHRVDKGYMADWTHQMRVVLQHIVKRPQIHFALFFIV
jgi:hypothetical protein